MSDYDRKYNAAIAELERTGMWRSHYVTPIFRAQRAVGWQVQPPHYAPFWHTTLSYALMFAVVWGLLMWATIWRGEAFSVPAAIGASGVAGLLFGLVNAAFYARGRRKHGLSRWDDL